ncbi:UNVERIFIED_CONTAM: hypothetical protein RKD50_000335 [Streptomyces canus]
MPVEQVGRNVGVWKELAAAHRVTDTAVRDSMAERFAALGANPTPEDVVETNRGATGGHACRRPAAHTPYEKCPTSPLVRRAAAAFHARLGGVSGRSVRSSRLA